MSGGQVIGGLVGAVAGFLIGGPTGAIYGAQLGLLAGGYLAPPKGPTITGPRLDDLTVQTSTYGAVIPRVYGTVAVNGNVFWLENNSLKETMTKKKSGGKGGGGKTTTRTYTYSATFAVGLCKGPIKAVRRIWIGPNLIYDADSTDPGTIAASEAAAAGFRLYLGTDTQLADERMQATLGVANTPAWRGLAYLVFYDLPLAPYGNSLAGAQVRAEIVMKKPEPQVNGYATGYNAYPVSNPEPELAYGAGVYVWIPNEGDLYYSTTYYTSTDGGVTWTSRVKVNQAYNYRVLTFVGNLFIYGTTGDLYTSPDGINWSDPIVIYPGEWSKPAFAWTGSLYVGVFSKKLIYSTNAVTWDKTVTLPGSASSYYTMIAWNGSRLVAISPADGWLITSTDGINWTHTATVAVDTWTCLISRGNEFFAGSKSSNKVLYSDGGLAWEEVVTTENIGTLVRCYDDVVGISTLSHGFINAGGKSFIAQMSFGSANPNWIYLVWNGSNKILPLKQFSSDKYAISIVVISPGSPSATTTLGEIVSAESLLSGLLTAADIDVTTLTPLVTGYLVSSIGAIRGAIEPLQASWPFDARQHGYKIEYLLRTGSASVATIPAADLDARSAGDEPKAQVITRREMDSQLHRRVTVQHLDYDREYNVGTQYAERLNTSAINATVLDLPIVLTSTEAAGKAEVLLYLYWLERYDVAVNLPPTYHHLEPGDVVTLVTPEGNVSLRLTAVTYTSDGRVECQAKYANPAVYTPTAVAAAPAVTGPTTITPVGASVYALLDLPLVSSAQSGPSFLAVMTGALAGWRGGVLMQSTDAGSTWNSVQEFGPPGATMGTCTNAIGVVESRLIDSASVLNVTLTQGELFSVTQLAMLGGANHFAYGADGRWEIIAAQTCTLVSGTSYVLKNLLRGRFGTEWAMGMHATNDALILLDTTDVAAIEMSSGSIGLSYLYRGITVDQDLSTDSNRSFTYSGVNLKPLSPVYLNGSRDSSSGDWTLTWIRRTRTGGEWRDSVDASLGEASEAYQIDIYADGSYSTNKKTLSVGAPACTYSSADQVADFGANQATLYLKLYQISATVGRGYPLTTSITR